MNHYVIEKEAYKLPDVNNSLMDPFRRSDDLKRTDAIYNDLGRLALNLDFAPIYNTPALEKSWSIYHRLNHRISNFPTGEVVVSSTLALYGESLGATHAILRVSKKPYPVEDFEKDLKAFTKHFVERPRLLGFPSKALESAESELAAMGLGGAVGSVIDYFATHPTANIINLGTVVGILGGGVAGVILKKVSDWYAGRQISDLSLYFGGSNARYVLENERNHVLTLAVQEEVYSFLLGENQQLTPEDFLEGIYNQLPPVLVANRMAEIEETKQYFASYHKKSGEAFLPLAEVSSILLRAHFKATDQKASI